MIELAEVLLGAVVAAGVTTTVAIIKEWLSKGRSHTITVSVDGGDPFTIDDFRGSANEFRVLKRKLVEAAEQTEEAQESRAS